MVAVERREARVRQPDAEELRRVLDGDRHGAASATAPKKRRYSLSASPATGGGCRITKSAPASFAARDERDLPVHRGLGDRDRERRALADRLGRPVEDLPSLGGVELVGLGGEAEHGDAVGAVAHARLDLRAIGSRCGRPSASKNA